MYYSVRVFDHHYKQNKNIKLNEYLQNYYGGELIVLVNKNLSPQIKLK